MLEIIHKLGEPMKSKSLAVLTLISLFLVGCIPSLHPLYTENDLVFEPSLLGNWVEKGGEVSYEFITNDSSSYTMIYTEDSIPSKFTAYLTNVGDHLFLDLLPEKPECGNEFHKEYLIPTHSFFKVSIEKDVLTLDGLDVDWFRDLYQEGKTELSREVIQGYDFVLTASTKELREFVLKYAENESAFPKGEKAFRQ